MPKIAPEERWKRTVLEKPSIFEVEKELVVRCKICEVGIKLRSSLDSLSILKHEKTEKHKRNFLYLQGASLSHQATPSEAESSEDREETCEPQKQPPEVQVLASSIVSGEIRLALQHATKVVEDYELPWRRTVNFDIHKQNLKDLVDLAYEKLYEDREVTKVKAILLENTASIILDDNDLKVLQSGDVVVFHFVPSQE